MSGVGLSFWIIDIEISVEIHLTTRDTARNLLILHLHNFVMTKLCNVQNLSVPIPTESFRRSKRNDLQIFPKDP